MLYRVHPHERDSNSQLLVVIDTDCLDICKSYCHTITAMTALTQVRYLKDESLCNLNSAMIYPSFECNKNIYIKLSAHDPLLE